MGFYKFWFYSDFMGWFFDFLEVHQKGEGWGPAIYDYKIRVTWVPPCIHKRIILLMFLNSTWHIFLHTIWNLWHSISYFTWHHTWHSIRSIFWHVIWHPIWHSFASTSSSPHPVEYPFQKRNQHEINHRSKIPWLSLTQLLHIRRAQHNKFVTEWDEIRRAYMEVY